MFHVRGVLKVFLGRVPNCDIFYKCMFFRQSKFEANRGKMTLGGRGACSPGKFWNPSLNMMHFVRTFSIYACYLRSEVDPETFGEEMFK